MIIPLKPYLIIPEFIEQPTWGGNYIVNFKKLGNTVFARKKIGQSYELYSGSCLTPAVSSDDPSCIPHTASPHGSSLKLSDLVLQSPVSVLGTNSLRVFGNALKTLIKFTQAKGNSFQLHVKEGTTGNKWLPKPESWYFLEKGLATVGITDQSKLTDYRKSAERIEAKMNQLSQAILNKTVTLAHARQRATEYIRKEDIYHYVNSVTIPANTIVDIHRGGIHHSWEEDDRNLPNGNIVYEVQVEANDEKSTIRSFDKGKIKDDGTIRPVQIGDYFTYLDPSPQANTPSLFLAKPTELFADNACRVESIFKTPYYSMHRIIMRKSTMNNYTAPEGTSFHHVFVLNGRIELTYRTVTISVGVGYSVFIPAVCSSYRLTPKTPEAILLTTFI